MIELRMSFADDATLAHELATNLKHGRAFIAGASGVEVLSDCMLVLVHPTTGVECALAAQAVLVSDAETMRGVGVQLRPFDAAVLAALEAFAREPAEKDAAEDPEPAEDDLLETDEETDDALDGDLQKGPVRHERLRKISQTEQQRIARHGDLNDRVVLERIYGKSVWAGLLQNPKMSVPEVARIARKGTAPRPLLDMILDNGAWIQSPVVRRALLGNPRVTGEAIMKLLRITPKHELKIIYKTTTYSTQVRESARKLLDT